MKILWNRSYSFSPYLRRSNHMQKWLVDSQFFLVILRPLGLIEPGMKPFPTAHSINWAKQLLVALILFFPSFFLPVSTASQWDRCLGPMWGSCKMSQGCSSRYSWEWWCGVQRLYEWARVHSVQRLYMQDICELNSVSGRRVSELTCYRAEQMNK